MPHILIVGPNRWLRRRAPDGRLDRCTVDWGNRRTSRVRITTSITDMLADRLDVALDLPRPCFGTDGRVRGALARLLTMLMATAAARERRARRAVAVKCRLRLNGRPWARLGVSADTFNALREHYPKGATPRQVRTMAFMWFAQGVGGQVADLVRITPRGRGGAARRRLTALLPHALLAARELVWLADDAGTPPAARAEKLFPETWATAGWDVERLPGGSVIALVDHRERLREARESYLALVDRVKPRIKEILTEDEVAEYVGYYRERAGRTAAKDALAVALVDRAFRGAWEAASHPGLVLGRLPFLRLPRDVFRQYLYGSHRRREAALLRYLLEEQPGEYLITLNAWGRDLLTEPGRAARAAGLATR